MRRWKGFTVIELVVAVTIVCLLIVVALASYHDTMKRKARTQVRTILTDSAEWLLVQHGSSKTYLLPRLPDPQSPRGGDPVYRIHLASEPVRSTDPNGVFPATTDQTFTLVAESVDGDDCGAFLLDQAGRRGVTGKNMTVAECWQ